MICLLTFNSTFQHSSVGLRYLKANMGDLEKNTIILEPTIQARIEDIVEKVIEINPKILGIGVYVWNSSQSLQFVALLKKLRPDICVVLGGPEVSYEYESQKIFTLADYLIPLEGDLAFPELCLAILENKKPTDKVIKKSLPEISKIKLPYYLYTDEDIKNRIIYVEASRGCPYKCEYCLSSLDKVVRNFEVGIFLHEIQVLMDRGARHFKFLDRTFNLSPKVSQEILQFFLDRSNLELFLHFEMVPDRLPLEIRNLISKFPAGSLQFEVGIQTLNPFVASLVSRKNDLNKVQENFKFLIENTHVHIHADLIAGLPGEDLASFSKGFDQLYQFGPHEIQVGILKRLKGTPIARHEAEWGLIYSDTQPFQILQTKTLSFTEVQFLTRFSKYWDLYQNHGNFPRVMKILLDTKSERNPSAFKAFSEFVEFLQEKFVSNYGHSLEGLAKELWNYLREKPKVDETDLTQALIQDYCHGLKRRDLPSFLKNTSSAASKRKISEFNLRQKNHSRDTAEDASSVQTSATTHLKN